MHLIHPPKARQFPSRRSSSSCSHWWDLNVNLNGSRVGSSAADIYLSDSWICFIALTQQEVENLPPMRHNLTRATPLINFEFYGPFPGGFEFHFICNKNTIGTAYEFHIISGWLGNRSPFLLRCPSSWKIACNKLLANYLTDSFVSNFCWGGDHVHDHLASSSVRTCSPSPSLSVRNWMSATNKCKKLILIGREEKSLAPQRMSYISFAYWISISRLYSFPLTSSSLFFGLWRHCGSY